MAGDMQQELKAAAFIFIVTAIAGCAASSRNTGANSKLSATAATLTESETAVEGDTVDIRRSQPSDRSATSVVSTKSAKSPTRHANFEVESDGRERDSSTQASAEQILPINLAAALKLSSASPIDVQLAAERIRLASAQLDQAKALWLPTITAGSDYNRHDGPIQDVAGSIINTSRSSTMLGVGSGIGSAAVFSPTDAIFAPLAAGQLVAARTADTATAANNALVAVTDAYFAVEQARGELAGARDATRRINDVVARVKKLSPGLVSELEVTRAETHLARRQAAELAALERWQVASAELARILRLQPTAQLEPLEPPELQIHLIDDRQSVDELVAVGLTYRPELASNQAQVQATLTLLRQEKLRPLIPSVLLRGFSTPVTGTLGYGLFGGGNNGTISNFGSREDFDLQVLWQLDNLGFGNAARIRGRESELRAATLELFKIQDRVAAEVTQAHAQAEQARRRVGFAEVETKLAIESYDKNFGALGQIRHAGELVQTVVRPQEVIAAVQDLAQAYYNVYGAIADSNRAQFRLYRALGRPAQISEEITSAEATKPTFALPEPGEQRTPPETSPSENSESPP
jgi:outer membrane protein TolC